MSWDEVFKHPLIKKKDAGDTVQEVKVNTDTREILLKLQSSFSKQGAKWSYNVI
jgi:hypothetical protein